MMKTKNKKLKKSALCSAILGAFSSTHAATISVDDNCSLIDAIQSANGDVAVGLCTAGSGDDVIQVVTPNDSIVINTVFVPPVRSVNTPAFLNRGGGGNLGLPAINSNITIEGNGLTLSADHSTENFGLFEVIAGGDLTLRDTTVTGADNGSGIGSGLLSIYGRVSIENCTFALNNGAVLLAFSAGNEITNSVIRHNTNTGQFAAGFQAYFAGVDINQTSFIDNEHASFNGGVGVGRGEGGLSTIAGGAGLIQSEVSITESTFSGNKSIFGAAIFINSYSSSSASPGRGEIEIVSQLTLTNSTISNNQANVAGGILNYGDSTINMSGTLIAGNHVPSTYSVYYGDSSNIYNGVSSTININANNIIGDNGMTGSTNLTLGATDQSFSNDAKDNLYPLSFSQGQLVHPLKAGSIAIDGNDLTCFGSTSDQEGKGRGIDGDGNGSFICDVGAFEHSLPILANSAPCTFENALESAETDASVGGCQSGNGHDIIVLPENSTQTFSSINPSSYYAFGIAGIETAVTIDANGSVIERDSTAVDNFDLFLVEANGQLNLIDATVTGASGPIAAITTLAGNVNVVDSKIINNQSLALFDYISINSSVINSTVSQNTMTPSSFLTGFSPLTTNESTGFELKQSTISGNSGLTGGGVDFRGVTLASMDNSTISDNTAGYVGGLIASTYTGSQFVKGVNISNSTITANSGTYVGGVFANLSPSYFGPSMSHTIVSGNELVPLPPVPTLNSNHITGRFSNLASLSTLPFRGGNRGGLIPVTEIYSGTPYFSLNSQNIIGQSASSGTYGVTIGVSDIVPAGSTDTVIENTLADNGGNTLTHLPVQGGPAVDGGSQICGQNEDQIGRIRPWDGDNDGSDRCDIGSVEVGSVFASDLIFKDGFDATIILRRNVLND